MVDEGYYSKLTLEQQEKLDKETTDIFLKIGEGVKGLLEMKKKGVPFNLVLGAAGPSLRDVVKTLFPED